MYITTIRIIETDIHNYPFFDSIYFQRLSIWGKYLEYVIGIIVYLLLFCSYNTLISVKISYSYFSWQSFVQKLIETLHHRASSSFERKKCTVLLQYFLKLLKDYNVIFISWLCNFWQYIIHKRVMEDFYMVSLHVVFLIFNV